MASHLIVGHPAIVIWNSQNETSEAGTHDVIHEIRQLDLSDRPWNNSYGKVERDSDVWSTHPYAFIGGDTDMAQFAHMPKIPDTPGAPNGGRPYEGKTPMIINECGWLWLYWSGEPTRLTKSQWKHLAPGATPAERFRIYARVIAAKTEFWRAARTLAGVMEFCALSRDGTLIQIWVGDHWQDVHTEPVNCEVNTFGHAATSLPIKFPIESGDYELAAELDGPGIEKVRSWRDWKIL